jgi:hypothetical protein
LETKRIVGVLLLIFVKEEHLRHVKDVQTGLAAVGIMGMMVSSVFFNANLIGILFDLIKGKQSWCSNSIQFS